MPKPLPPPLLGRYSLGPLLGRGSQSSVYLARFIPSNATVAVKVISKDSLPAQTADCLLREIEAMRRLPHPHIVRLHEVLATKSKIYLVMDYAARGDLSSLRGPLPYRAVRRLFSQLVSALRFCHSRGVSHRDVKPHNLLLDAAGDLLVADFGLSALADARNGDQLRTRCGTPIFLAPEVFLGKAYDGAKADAWSCGVVLYVLLTGMLPFGDGCDLQSYYRKAAKRDLKLPSTVPPVIRTVVWRLLDPRPESRMGLAEVAEVQWVKVELLNKPSEGKECTGKPRMEAANAFEIIATASGLDLRGIFEEEAWEEGRFSSEETAEEVERRVEQEGRTWGLTVRRGKDAGLELCAGDGEPVVRVEVVELGKKLRMGVVEAKRRKLTHGLFGLSELRVGLGSLVSWF